MAEDSSVRRATLALATIVLLGGLGSCAKPPPPPPPPTVIKATFGATADVNPDSRGRPSPIVVRIYELKATAAFGRADFFSLWDREKETLGDELVAREEVQLRPGESKTIERPAAADARQFGAVAAYRDLERSGWRAAVALEPHRVNTLSVEAGARSLSMTKR